MDRRKFIQKASLAAGMFALPAILPSGRLFASTGERKVNHVVFCLFAGGIRNLESMHKKEGNLMPYSLPGNEAISSDIAPGMDSIPGPWGPALSSFGTLFKEFRYNDTQTVHYNGHAAAITGKYSRQVQIMKPLPNPTLFEFFRKHSSPQPAALNTWWVSDQAGPFPFLNTSDYPGYGPQYGANMIQPSSFFTSNLLAGMKSFNGDELDRMDKLTRFFNKNFQGGGKLSQEGRLSIENNPEHALRIQQFLKQMITGVYSGEFVDPWNMGKSMNEDMVNIFTACKILENFQPELLVVNMQDSDVGHSNFTQYCNNMRKADFSLYKLWETIQNTPGLKDDTVLVVAPEFGRNLEHNTLVDHFGRNALDHTGDENSKEVFCMILGPENIVKRGQIIDKVRGETIDIVPTIAHILGFLDEIPGRMMEGKVLREAFV